METTFNYINLCDWKYTTFEYTSDTITTYGLHKTNIETY